MVVGGKKRLKIAAMLLTSLFTTQTTFALEGPVVTAPVGQINGVSQQSVLAYKGIPYAQATIGELRWQPPQAISAFSKPFDAVEYGANCPQPNKQQTSEDCLFLNVFTPALKSVADALPVFVWVHGGGYVMGSGDLPDDVVSRWVEAGMVVVSFNYRLGAMGIFAHPQLDQQAGANYSVMDMTAALHWVQENISSFGGDPDKVTIAGNSAGGMAIQMLMVTQDGEGTFRGAISQSGYGSWPLPRTTSAGAESGKASAEAISADIATRASGEANAGIAALYEIPAEQFVKAINGFHLPVVDGKTLNDEPARLFEQGKQHKVPYISGGNSYDGSVYPYAGVAPQRLLELTTSVADEVKQAYGLAAPGLNALPFQHLFGDLRYVLAGSVTTQAMSAVRQPGYRYFFDVADGGTPGARHGAETGALFGGNQPAVNAMQGYWRNFILTGNPNGNGLPQWEPVSDNNENWMIFDDIAHLEKTVRGEKLRVLKAAYQSWRE